MLSQFRMERTHVLGDKLLKISVGCTLQWKKDAKGVMVRVEGIEGVGGVKYDKGVLNVSDVLNPLNVC